MDSVRIAQVLRLYPLATSPQAEEYLQLRDEGHSLHAAARIAGIARPHWPKHDNVKSVESGATLSVADQEKAFGTIAQVCTNVVNAELHRVRVFANEARLNGTPAGDALREHAKAISTVRAMVGVMELEHGEGSLPVSLIDTLDAARNEAEYLAGSYVLSPQGEGAHAAGLWEGSR